MRVLDVLAAPSGRGAASAWVRTVYPASVRTLRAQRHQQNLGLLVGIDGDNLGALARQRELAQALETAGMPPRADDESIAVLAPTWSIETWLAHLCGRPEIREDHGLKTDPTCRVLWDDGRSEATTLTRAVEAWGQAPAAVHSLAEAYREAARVGLG